MYPPRLLALIRLGVLLGMELVAFGQFSVTCLWNQNEVAKGFAITVLGTILYTLQKILREYENTLVNLQPVHDPLVLRIKRSFTKSTLANQATGAILSTHDIKLLVNSSIQCDMERHELCSSDSMDACSSSDKENEDEEEVTQLFDPTASSHKKRYIKKLLSNMHSSILDLFDHDPEELLVYEFGEQVLRSTDDDLLYCDNSQLYMITEEKDEELGDTLGISNELNDDVDAVLVKEFGVIVLDETQIDFDLLLSVADI